MSGWWRGARQERGEDIQTRSSWAAWCIWYTAASTNTCMIW